MGYVGRVGRTVASVAATIPNVTGAYSAFSAVGSAFEIASAIGAEGGVVAQLLVTDRASAMSGLRLHFWNQVPPHVADKSAWMLPSGQENGYLGYIDVLSSDWVTAGISGGNTAMHARVINQNIGLYNNSGNNRSVWCNVQALNNLTFGGLNSAQTVRLVNLQD